MKNSGVHARVAKALAAALLAAFALIGEAAAQGAPRARTSTAPFAGFGSNSREPVKVDAARLEVFDKENRVVYTGDVVAVQGQTTVRCTSMTVHYILNRDQRAGTASAQPQAAGENAAPAARPAAAAGQNSIRQIDCRGPVSVLSGTQSATSDRLVYDAEKETVTLTGKVVISDCDNVQRGERVVYDVRTGRATVDAGAGGRVQGVFTPGGEERRGNGKDCGPSRPAAPPIRP